MSSPSTTSGDGPESEPTLHEDWLNGVIPHRDLILPVVIARNELQGFNHVQALSIWIHFYGAAKEWQAESGIPPRNRSLDECEPWEASDGLANDAVDLARRVLPGSPAYEDLVEQYSECQILAAICLEHASRTPKYGLLLFPKKEDFIIAQKAALECHVRGEAARLEKVAIEAGRESLRVAADHFGPAYKRERARTEGLQEAQARSAKSRQKNAEDFQRHALEQAEKKFREDPTQTIKEVAESISSEAPEGLGRKPSYIEKLISSRGLKAAVMRELKQPHRE